MKNRRITGVSRRGKVKEDKELREVTVWEKRWEKADRQWVQWVRHRNGECLRKKW